MFPPELFAAQPRNHRHGEQHASLPRFFARLNHLVSRYAFFDCRQHLIRAAFQPHINHVQSRFTKAAQFLRRFIQNVLWRAVNRNPLRLRKIFVALFQNMQHILCFHNQRVTVCQKNPAHLDMAVIFPRHFQILLHIRQRTNPKGLILVHVAECAGISCAAYGKLDNQTAGFAWRPVNGTFISHFYLSLSLLCYF